MTYESFMRIPHLKSPRGVALLLAVIFTAVVLSIGLSLADISYKQIILASSARQSEYAFYNADSALECALELDQQYDAFDLSTESITATPVSAPVSCEAVTPTITSSGTQGVSITSVLTIPCGSASNATVTITKSSIAAGDTFHTHFYADGFNNCNASDPARVERGIEARY